MGQAQTKPALSLEEIRLLKAHVEELLRSSHFRNSKRYPRFLQKVVDCTVAADFDELKERTLGHSVFDRAADYDTSADPIVRITAGEIRKRLAQYYQESGSNPAVRISLPVGGYIPEFHFGAEAGAAEALIPDSPKASAEDALELPAPDALLGRPPQTGDLQRARVLGAKWTIPLTALVASLLTLAVVFGGKFASRSIRGSRTSGLMQFWSPLMAENDPAPFIVGRTTLVLPLDSDPSLEASLLGIKSKIAISDALAFSRICSLIRTETRNCTLQISNQATISDLRRSPVVVIGLFNNEWSSRLLAPLRFRINHNVDPQGITHEAWITDTKDPKARWGLDFGERLDSVSRDYGILARFDSTLTGQPVFVVGGLSSLATEGVGELATDPRAMDQLLQMAPKGKPFQNVEAVIETDVINGKPGQSHVLAADFW